MKRAFIIHGAYGSPDENWFFFAKAEIASLGYEVIIPKFPTPEEQNLKNWFSVFDKYMHEIDEETILIGHSLGCAFILNVLEKINVRVRGCYLVSGWIGELGKPQFDPINKTIADREFNFDKIRDNCSLFIQIHGDDDPYVPLSKALELRKRILSELIIIKKGGHLNSESGFIRFPRLIDLVKTHTEK